MNESDRPWVPRIVPDDRGASRSTDLPVFLQRVEMRVDAALASALSTAAVGAAPAHQVPQILSAVPREQLERLAAVAHDAATANLDLYLEQRDKAAALWDELDAQSRRVEFFKGMFDRAMSTLERLGGHELPELVQLRTEATRHTLAAEGRAKGAEAARARKALKLRMEDDELRRRAEGLRRLEQLSNSGIAKRLGCSRRKVAKLFGEPWTS